MWNTSNLNTSSNEGGFIPQSSVKKSTLKMRLIPCSVHEILSAQQKGDIFVTKTGIDINFVKIVGIIKSINLTSSFVDYEINDRTGNNIVVKQYNDQETEGNVPTVPGNWKVGSYVKVIGHIKSQKGINFLNSLKIVKLLSFNEVSHHIISVINTHQLLKGTMTNDLVDANQSMFVDNLRDKLIKLFEQNNHMSDGISLQFIKRALPDHREHEIEKKIEFLTHEGFIYSTISDDVFKLT